MAGGFTRLFSLAFFISCAIGCARGHDENPAIEPDRIPVARHQGVGVALMERKKAYSKDEKIYFSFSNSSENKIFYYCALQQEVEKEWQEFVMGLDGGEAVEGGVRIHTAPAHEVVSSFFVPSRSIDPIQHSAVFNKSIRIVCYLGEDIAGLRRSKIGISSESFRIEKP